MEQEYVSVEEAEDRTNYLEGRGHEVKSCWCLDCMNIGKCGTCNGIGTGIGFIIGIERPPKHYYKDRQISILGI